MTLRARREIHFSKRTKEPKGSKCDEEKIAKIGCRDSIAQLALTGQVPYQDFTFSITAAGSDGRRNISL